MILTILQALIALPKIGLMLENLFDKIYTAYKIIKIERQKEKIDHAIDKIDKTKDQRDLEDLLRGN